MAHLGLGLTRDEKSFGTLKLAELTESRGSIES